MRSILPALTLVTGGGHSKDFTEEGKVIIHPKITGNVELIFRNGNEYSTCTGRIIEGCILTAKHCREHAKYANAEIFVGFNPFVGQGSTPHSYGIEAVDLGETGDLTNDISIIKLYKPLTPNISTDREALADKPLDFSDPKTLPQGVIVGYGLSNTPEDWTNNQNPTMIDLGLGARRSGFSLLTGYGAFIDPSANLGQPVSTKGDMLWSARGPSIGAHGDSGMVIDVDGKLHGVFSEATGYTMVIPGRDKKLHVNEITGNRYTSIPHHHKEIIAALDKLDCKGNTLDALFASAGDILELHDGFVGTEKGFSWKSLPEDSKKEFEGIIARLANFPPGAKFELGTPKLTAEGLKFDVNGMVGERANNQTLTIPLPKRE